MISFLNNRNNNEVFIAVGNFSPNAYIWASEMMLQTDKVVGLLSPFLLTESLNISIDDSWDGTGSAVARFPSYLAIAVSKSGFSWARRKLFELICKIPESQL